MTQTRYLAQCWSDMDATPEEIATALRLLSVASGGTFTYTPLPDGAVEITLTTPGRGDNG